LLLNPSVLNIAYIRGQIMDKVVENFTTKNGRSPTDEEMGPLRVQAGEYAQQILAQPQAGDEEEVEEDDDDEGEGEGEGEGEEERQGEDDEQDEEEEEEEEGNREQSLSSQ
jgi:hypothetical protein